MLLEISGLSYRESGAYVLKDISLGIRKGECWVITGASGSGKSTLLRCIQQYKSFTETIRFADGAEPVVKLITHQHEFKNLSGISNFYYQQRFNATESSDCKTVWEDLVDEVGEADAMRGMELMEISYLKDEPQLQLSNGEHKRFQIAKALAHNAQWLLLDNAFTGLDAHARIMLERIIKDLKHKDVSVIMVEREYLPGFFTHVCELDKGILTGVFTREQYLKFGNRKHIAREDIDLSKLPVADDLEFEYAVRMKNVNVKYGDRLILDNVSWEVKKGEKWCLTGPNGSGKSTLLSLITADNPQAFANEIYLFDRRKGSGESIWEIKKKIGFVSPEVHQYFDRSQSVFNVVASGLFDTIGLFRKLNKTQQEQVETCIAMFGLQQYAARAFWQLSHGMQRWSLIARAVVKNPVLLILDEPGQGLDEMFRARAMSFIAQECLNAQRTLICVTHHEDEIPEGITGRIHIEKGKIKEIIHYGEEVDSDSGRWDRP
ncbi:MAG TPA: ATP-binding cassette domain-containing protein [Ginsengibacter sp.]|nr:ATP-binding cassette domain-containing protein [Ginsengibacter sp.]HRP43720.1 ATP-binding cassette domain-containing protein [Ginsengibacter sp.]